LTEVEISSHTVLLRNICKGIPISLVKESLQESLAALWNDIQEKDG
jgi:hypothetical protein